MSERSPSRRAEQREAVASLHLTAAERAVEIMRPWLLLALYLGLALRAHYWLAAPVAVATCFAAFVQMHDTLHESLGASKRTQSVLLTASGLLLLKSGNALKATHLRHHGKCLGAHDPEGAPAHWSLPRVLVAGPFHILAMRREAMLIAPRTKRRQWLETAATVAVIGTAIGAWILWRSPVGLLYWAVAAALSAAMPLWAAYIPHRLAARSPVVRTAARFTQLWTPVLSSFAYHHVHHTHPKVPTALLPRAAAIAGNDLTEHVHGAEKP